MLMVVLFPDFLCKYIPGVRDAMKLIHGMFDSFREDYNDHLKDWDPDNPRDFVDCVITERKRVEAENDTQSSFYGANGDINYVNSMQDLFLTGSETTSTTLMFLVLFCLHYPEAMKKAQKEIDSVVGRSRYAIKVQSMSSNGSISGSFFRLPSWDDRSNLPYVEAFIAELTRCGDIVPFGVQHLNFREATYKEFT